MFFDRKLQARDFGPNGISISLISSAINVFMHTFDCLFRSQELRKFCMEWIDRPSLCRSFKFCPTVCSPGMDVYLVLFTVTSRPASLLVTKEALFLAPSHNCEKQLLNSSCLPVRLSAWNNSVPTGRSFMKSDPSLFFEKYVKFH